MFQLGTQNVRSASPNPSSGNVGDKTATTDTFQKNSDTSAENLQSKLNSKTMNEKLDKMDIEAFMREKDWRRFDCTTWHLEPTVRLLSWAGKSIEPYGIDYILNKLGFSHARTTIPKWLQRGFMDGVDKLEALLIIQLLSLVKDDRGCTNADKN